MNAGTTANGTRYCRTCGFADCPGKDTGNCPRWPAAAPFCGCGEPMHGGPCQPGTRP